MADLVVCSHRGPVVFERTAHGIEGKRGGGGLVGALLPVLESAGGTWIAAALSDTDREVASGGPRDQESYALRLLDLPADMHRSHYETVSNTYLWFLFHYLFDVPTEPVFGTGFAEDWQAYRDVNERYAEAVREAGRADAVLVHDYHLMLVGAALRRMRVRRPLLYFHHTPWCDPAYFGLLPHHVREEVITGLLAHDVVGFHARRWADAFLACCEAWVPRVRVSGDVVSLGRRTTRVVVAPVPLDSERVRAAAADERTQGWISTHDDMRAGRRLLLRVDRIDLSKNPLRGFLAYEALLADRPDLVDSTVFLALLYPSRPNVERYRRYFAECLGVVRRVNERYAASPEDGPIVLHFEDDFHRSLAALRISDALLVNPVFDGLNLVAKEGALVNERDGVLLLSANAGAHEELGAAALTVDPFDVAQTAGAMATAFEMPRANRTRRATRLKRLVEPRTPADWARAQLAAAGL